VNYPFKSEIMTVLTTSHVHHISRVSCQLSQQWMSLNIPLFAMVKCSFTS